MPDPIHITVNGAARELTAPHTLMHLIADLGLPVETLLIEHNESALLQHEIPKRLLKSGDRIEFLRIAAGG